MSGTEMIFDINGYSLLQSGLIIFIFLLIGFVGYVMGYSIDRNSNKFNEKKLKKRRVNHFVRSVVLFLFLILIFSSPILHSIDSALGLIKTEEIMIVSVDGNRYYLLIYDDKNDKYKVSREVKGFEDEKVLQLVGYRCDIEYYRLSKIVKRIVILE